MAHIMEDMEKRIKCYSDCPPFMIAYLRYLAVFRGLTPGASAASFLTVREFCQYIHYKNKFHEKPPGPEAHRQSICNMKLSELESITLEAAMEYIDFLEGIVGNRPETINRKVSMLRSFFNYLVDLQSELGVSLADNPFLNTKVQIFQKPAQIMSDAEIKKLLDSITGVNAVRDRAIVILLLSTGIRMEELVALDEDDYSGSSLIIGGDTPRVIELNDTCINALNSYISEYRSPIEDLLKDDALFISQIRKKRLAYRSLHCTIEKQMTVAGLLEKGYSASTLRDTAIQKVLDTCEGHEIAAAMKYLGFRQTDSCRRFSVKHSMASKFRNLDIPGGEDYV